MNLSQVAGFGYFVRSDFGQADMMMSGVVLRLKDYGYHREAPVSSSKRNGNFRFDLN
jgi:hypothetical protein